MEAVGADELHLERSIPADASLGRVLALVRYLRAHCEWDARQTPETLVPYLLEEAHEVAESVRELRRAGDDASPAERELAGELGDLLLNIAFQIVLAEERGAFGPGEVVASLEGKMIARHPHVYGDAEAPPDWESLKARERATDGRASGDDRPPGRPSPGDPLAGIPAGLEALSRALRVQERASGVGFDWPDVSGAMEKLREEVDELDAGLAATGEDRAASPSSAGPTPSPEVVDEAGDLLFAAVNVCRLAGVHPESALTGATEKFVGRFRQVAERAEAEGLDLRTAGLEALDRLWDGVKADE